MFYIITLIAGIARLDQGSGCEPEIPDSECDSRMLIGTKHSQSVSMHSGAFKHGRVGF